MNTITANYASGKLKHQLQAGDNMIYSDASVADGGEGAGPSPHELLGMALAACTGITMRMYAQRKAWPLENAEVKVNIVKVENLEIFNRTIQFFGPLDEEQKKRLLDIADKCPIHKALLGKIEIQTDML
jgi:putative redox protein